MAQNPLPHGPCKCPKHSCKGPAALRVKRGDSTFDLCTLCARSTDELVEVLAKPDDSPYVFFDHDPIGFLMLSLHFVKQEKKELEEMEKRLANIPIIPEAEVEKMFDELLGKSEKKGAKILAFPGVKLDFGVN